MDLNLIKQFVLKCGNLYLENINGYIVPKTLISFNGQEIPLINNRNNALINNKSSYSECFEDDINRKISRGEEYLYYIPEFPIIIENRDLWNNILSFYGAYRPDFIHTNYFFLDYFFPSLNCCVEIDSNYHDRKELYDKARDLYIYKTYGIATTRFMCYNRDNKQAYLNKLNRFYESILNRFSKWNIAINNNFTYIDYSETIINNFIIKNKQALEFIDKLIYYFGNWGFYTNDVIKISYQDLSKIDYRNFSNNTSIYKKNSPEKLLLNGILVLIEQLYGKKLEIV